ncbi:MAG: hypothetical protein FJX64_12430, partial [Alphaproteobacteria bacterium]|nr:hypothetical protein [Alphaproteobacteria bacterium]
MVVPYAERRVVHRRAQHRDRRGAADVSPQMTRLPPIAGEWIDRSKEISFFFEGRPYTGFHGDTISSALAANGVRLLGR